MKVLPTTPAPQVATPSYVDFGATLTPSLGGSEQRINRLGNRFRLSVTMPPMQNKEAGRVFIARLIRGHSEGLRMNFPLGGFNPGTEAEIGSPVVSGSSQSGRLLNLRGFTPGYTVKEGQFFSILTGTPEGHFLYQADEEVTANFTGAIQLTINPLLRVSPDDGDICFFHKPKIEGLVEGSDWQWDYALDYNVGIEFVIKERR